MRQGDGTDLLGASDPRSASIGIIRVDPTDARQDVLTAILAQDELKREQIAVVLHEQNRAFQGPVDFDGLKDMRRRLNADLVIVARSGSGPAEFARQRRFAVYSSLENFASAIRSETPEREVRRGWFGRKQKTSPLAPSAGRKAEVAPTTGAIDVRQPQAPSAPAGASKSASPLAVPAGSFEALGEVRKERDEQEDMPTLASPSNGAVKAGDVAGAVGAGALSASFFDNDEDLLAPPPSQVAANGAMPPAPSSKGASEKPSRMSKPSHTPPSMRAVEPEVITLATPKSRPKSTVKLPSIPPDADASPPVKNGNTGKQRAALVGASMAASANASASVFASSRAPFASTGAPPSGGSAGAPVGTAGGPPRRRSRRLLALLLALLTVLLLVGIVFASPIGQQAIHTIIPGSTITATVTITPKSQDVVDNFVITAVTGTPNPSARQVQARLISVTSASQSASAGATGSISGRRATGTLTFINNNLQSVTIAGGTLTGRSGVPVFFSGPLTIPIGSISVLGTAVNQGTNGDIPALDIAGTCCTGGVLVRNTSAFSGGVNPQPNMVITQNDITRASNNLIALVKPDAQSRLQGLVKANEDVVPNSLSCTAHGQANHRAGDIATKVTVTGTATCGEEVFDRASALTLAATALRAKAASDPGAGYAPVGNKIVTGVTQVTVIDSKHTVSVLVRAEGVWVYQFSDALKQQLATAIANKSKSDATTYLRAVVGVSDVSISISSGNTLPAANDITIVIKTVAGPSGTPTLIPGSPTPTTNPGTTPTPSPTAQNGQGGS